MFVPDKKLYPRYDAWLETGIKAARRTEKLVRATSKHEQVSKN